MWRILFLLFLPTLLFANHNELPDLPDCWDKEGEEIFWDAASLCNQLEIEEEPEICEWPSDDSFSIQLKLKELEELSPGQVLRCEGRIGGLKVDLGIACSFFHRLHLTEQEIEEGTADLACHLGDLLPHQGKQLGLLTYQNGIKTSMKVFLESCETIAKKVPEGTLLIGLHNKTKGLTRDVLRILREVAFIDTPAVLKTRKLIKELSLRMHSINPELLWGSILHSEAGVITRRAIEGLDPSLRVILKEHLYVFAMSPVLPIPANYGYYSLNLYSKHDFLSVGGYLFGIGGRKLADFLFDTNNCHLFFIPSASKWRDRTLLFFDHSFLGGTYTNALGDQIQRWRTRYGFYKGSAG